MGPSVEDSSVVHTILHASSHASCTLPRPAGTMMEPGNALVWTNPQTLPEKVDQFRAPSISRRKLGRLRRKDLSDYLIDNFNPSSHVRYVRSNLALVGELASI